MPHVKVKDLPPQLREALASLGYARLDIALNPATTYCMSAGGSGSGRRAFVCAVNLQTGERKLAHGSWGGANMSSPINSVDLDTESRALPINFAVIHGSEGNSVYATIDVNPATLTPMLPAAPSCTNFERSILAMVGGLTSAGRKDAIDRMCREAGDTVTRGMSYSDPLRYPLQLQGEKAMLGEINAAIDTLVSLGLLKRNKAGAISITTEGKNAKGSERFY